MASKTTNVLITGIGRYLAETFLARPEHTVVAAVRNPGTTTLKECQPAEGSRLLLVKIENEVDDDPTTAVQQMRAAGIHYLDLVVVNAGITPVSAYRRLEDADPAQLREMLAINTVSFISLFRAVQPLLQAAAAGGEAGGPLIQCGAAGRHEPGQRQGPHGAVRRHQGGPELLDPARAFREPVVDSLGHEPRLHADGERAGDGRLSGSPHAPVSLEKSCAGLLSRIDGATREETSGRFFRFDRVEMTF
ncbi:hypothetical protein PG984_016462 [Apiospora sp. TS-2023a]